MYYFSISVLKKSSVNTGDTGLIPGWGRSSGEGNGTPLPVFLPGESHGQRSLAGHGPWGRRESDTTEVTEHNCLSASTFAFHPLPIFLQHSSRSEPFFFFWPLCHIRDFSSPTRDQPGIGPRPPALGAQSLNHWTTREVPQSELLKHKLDHIIALFKNLFHSEEKLKYVKSSRRPHMC